MERRGKPKKTVLSRARCGIRSHHPEIRHELKPRVSRLTNCTRQVHQFPFLKDKTAR